MITVDTVRAGMGVPPAVVMYDTKYSKNASRALRNCSAFGVEQLWITGDRWTDEWVGRKGKPRPPREERMKDHEGVTLFRCERPLEAFDPKVSTPVAVEVSRNAQDIAFYEFPENPVFVDGPAALPPVRHPAHPALRQPRGCRRDDAADVAHMETTERTGSAPAQLRDARRGSRIPGRGHGTGMECMIMSETETAAPVVHVNPTVYVVSILPEDHGHWDVNSRGYWSLEVRRRGTWNGREQWYVCDSNSFRWLTRRGTWVASYDRLNRHHCYFDNLEDALALAREKAPEVGIGDIPATKALARTEAYRAAGKGWEERP